MADHTPTPWTAGHYSSIVGVPIIAQPDPKSNSIVVAGTRSARPETPEEFRAEVEANAALIVRAVNNHTSLVEALENAIKIASEAADEWDKAPSGMKAGKILLALCGHLKGYRADISEIHAALAAAKAGA